jgi:phosphoglycolate phosphatase
MRFSGNGRRRSVATPLGCGAERGAVRRRGGHIFFDLDGTLIDPRVGIVGCLEYALEAVGAPIPEAAALERFIGPPLTSTFGQLLGAEDREKVDRAIAAYRVRFGATGLFESRVYEGIHDMLAALRATGRSLWVVTAKPTVYSARIVEHHGLRAYFQNVYGSELNGDRTDKAALIGHVLETERLSPREVVMVGDRVHDVLGARANGVASVGVRWGYGSADELATARPDAIAASPAELVRHVCG